jgi:RNA polymerase sigma-70 factor (ECF subfamily)
LRKAVYRQGYVDYLQQETPDCTFITEEAVLFNELDNVLHGLLENMPPKRREIYRLHREEGLSYKEISDRLSIAGSTVNTQLTKAIGYLRHHIRLFYSEKGKYITH